MVGPLEAVGVPHAGRPQEAPVQPVGPEVERAAHFRAVPLSLHHLGRSMSAGIGVGPQYALFVTDHNYWHTTEVHCRIVARGSPAITSADSNPALTKHRLGLESRHLGVDVTGGRQCMAVGNQPRAAS